MSSIILINVVNNGLLFLIGRDIPKKKYSVTVRFTDTTQLFETSNFIEPGYPPRVH